MTAAPAEKQPSPTGISYELTEDEVTFLTTSLLQERKGQLPEDEMVCLRIHGTSPYANLSRTVEAQVFSRDLNDTPGEMLDEYAPYEGSSWFLLVINQKLKRPEATLRIVEHSESGFSALNEIKGLPHNTDKDVLRPFSADDFYRDYGVDPAKTWDVGTIAVLDRSRRSAPKLGVVVPDTEPTGSYRAASDQKVQFLAPGLLYRGLYATAQANGIEHFVSIIHTHNPEEKDTGDTAYGKLRRMGIPFYPIYGMGPKWYDNDTYFQPAVALVQDFGLEMRGYTEWRIRIAQHVAETSVDEFSKGDAERELAKARAKRMMVEVLLTGFGLDQHFAQPHAIASEERPAV